MAHIAKYQKGFLWGLMAIGTAGLSHSQFLRSCGLHWTRISLTQWFLGAIQVLRIRSREGIQLVYIMPC